MAMSARAGRHDSDPSIAGDWTADYFRDFRLHVRQTVSDWIDNLCGASIRLKQAIYREILCNKTIRLRYASSRIDDQHTFRSIGRHAIMTGLLVGRFSHWCEIEHPIINLFKVAPQDIGCRSLLLGPHLLQILKKGERDARTILDQLIDLGYSADAIDAAIERFRKGNIMQIYSTKKGGARYRVYEHTMEAYRLILRDPAYLEVMMVRSYVKTERLQHMYDTGILDPADFTKRIKTALQFLEQLCADEVEFCDVATCPATLDSLTFQKALKKQQLLSTFRVVALSYLDNIKTARSIHTLPASSTEWDEFEHHKIFRLAAKWERELHPN